MKFLQQLPLWAISFWFVVPLLLSYLGMTIAAWPLRRSREQPWHERARHAHALRLLLGMQTLLWPLLAFISASFAKSQPETDSRAAHGIAPAIAALMAALLVRYVGERKIFASNYSMFQLFKGTVVNHFALGQVTLLIAIVAGVMMPGKLNAAVGIILVAMIAAVVFFTCGGSLLLLRAIRLLTPADERLTRIVRQAAEQVDFPSPATYIAHMPAANALAFPWNGRLAFTDGILQCLDDVQLESITAHEICHLGMPLSQKVVRLLNALALLVPLTLIKPLMGQFGKASVLPIAAGTLALIFVVQMISRRVMLREEQRADRAGAESSAAVYARALERVYQQNLTPANWQSPQGHPPLYDRMTASGVVPDYPKPRRPGRWLVLIALAVEAMLFLGITLLVLIAIGV